MYVWYLTILFLSIAKAVTGVALTANRYFPALPASIRQPCYYSIHGARVRNYPYYAGSKPSTIRSSCLSNGKKRQVLQFDFTEVASQLDTPIIETLHGNIRGVVEKTSDGQPYYSYRGIPYAMPPILEKRFAPPEPYTEKWKDVRNMTSYKSGCIGLDNEAYTVRDGVQRYAVTGSEDCLYLNVHLRFWLKSDNNLKTVIFFIHGGGFSFGSPQQFEATYLMDVGSVIYVNPAYRLGPLGFLSTGDEVVPGNNGLKDQVLALSWVKDNIESFGGNPAKIQIVGVDAGGASVHFMYFSPLAKDHFTSGYSFSGNIFSPWAFQKRETAVQRTKTLAKSLNCTTESSTALVQCLREKAAFDVVDKLRDMKTFFYNPFSLFTPVDDSQFRDAYFPEHPITLLKKGKVKSVPWLTGFTSQNYLYPLAEFVYYNASLTKLEKKWHEYLPSILFYNESCTDTAIALRAALGIPLRKLEYVSLANYVTDRNYINPGDKASSLMAEKSSADVYLYNFKYRGQRSTLSYITDVPVVGISNGDDAAFVFKRPFLNLTSTLDDKKMNFLMVDLMIKFAETGRPNLAVKWKPKTKNDRQAYFITGHAITDHSIQAARPPYITKYDYLFDGCSL